MKLSFDEKALVITIALLGGIIFALWYMLIQCQATCVGG